MQEKFNQQFNVLLPQKLQAAEQNIFWYTFSKVGDILHLNSTSADRFSTIVDTMGTLRKQTDKIIPKVIENPKKPSEVSIIKPAA